MNGAFAADLHQWISRSLPPDSTTAHAIPVPDGSRMFRFVVPGPFVPIYSCARMGALDVHEEAEDIMGLRVCSKA